MPARAQTGGVTRGTVFLGLTMVATHRASAALNRVVAGRWSFAPLSVGLLMYHAVIVGGFFSYLFGLALRLWALAARLSMRGPRAGFAVGCLGTLLLMLSHLFAAGIYGAFLVADRAVRVAQGRLRPAAAIAGLTEFLPAALLAQTVLPGGGGLHAWYLHDPGFLQAKAAGLAEALTCGSLRGDAALIVGLLACAASVARDIDARKAGRCGSTSARRSIRLSRQAGPDPCRRVREFGPARGGVSAADPAAGARHAGRRRRIGGARR